MCYRHRAMVHPRFCPLVRTSIDYSVPDRVIVLAGLVFYLTIYPSIYSISASPFSSVYTAALFSEYD